MFGGRWRRGVFLGGLAVLLLVPASARNTAREAAPTPTSFEFQVLTLTNAEREKRGLRPLSFHPALMNSARWMAEDMAIKGYFDHRDSLGRGVGARAEAFGYDFRMVGQNIAAGHRTAEEVVDGWMKSPGHRANILRPEFREIGVAYLPAQGSIYQRYWVQDFGVRR